MGEELTRSRHAATVAGILEQRDQSELAVQIRRRIGAARPCSGMTKASRARAERAGIHLPRIRRQVRDAYERSDDRASFAAALAEHDLAIEPGRTAGVLVVRQGNVDLGAIDRLVDRSRDEVAVRLACGLETTVDGFAGRTEVAPTYGATARPQLPVPSLPSIPCDLILHDLRSATDKWPMGWARLIDLLGALPAKGRADAVNDAADELVERAPVGSFASFEAMLTKALAHIDRSGSCPKGRSESLHEFADGVTACLDAIAQARERVTRGTGYVDGSEAGELGTRADRQHLGKTSINRSFIGL